MEIHYFQRYHQKENVATANTMLLLSRLYSYSPNKFYQVFKNHFFPDLFNPEITMRIQEKNEKSVPDATISQDSFKIVVETKLSDWFHKDQLDNHLKSFGNETVKVFITIASKHMNDKLKEDFGKSLDEYNRTNSTNIVHKNLTFEELVNDIQETIDERDYEMQDVLEDYLQYCYHDNLIDNNESWKWMKGRSVKDTFEFNMKENVYYYPVESWFRKHDFIGLYFDKSIRAIGKIRSTFIADKNDGNLNIEEGNASEEDKAKIELAMNDAKKYGYDLISKKHRYFFVEKFVETIFVKLTPYGMRTSKFFDLSELLNVNSLPDIEIIAKKLRELNW